MSKSTFQTVVDDTQYENLAPLKILTKKLQELAAIPFCGQPSIEREMNKKEKHSSPSAGRFRFNSSKSNGAVSPRVAHLPEFLHYRLAWSRQVGYTSASVRVAERSRKGG